MEESSTQGIHNEEEKEDYSPPKKKSKSEVLLYFHRVTMFLHTANFEKYRKSYFCPVTGCKCPYAIKKLANHLTTVYHIKDSVKRQEFLAMAKTSGQQLPKQTKVSITIPEAFWRKQLQDRSSHPLYQLCQQNLDQQQTITDTTSTKSL